MFFCISSSSTVLLRLLSLHLGLFSVALHLRICISFLRLHTRKRLHTYSKSISFFLHFAYHRQYNRFVSFEKAWCFVSLLSDCLSDIVIVSGYCRLISSHHLLLTPPIDITRCDSYLPPANESIQLGNSFSPEEDASKQREG